MPSTTSHAMPMCSSCSPGSGCWFDQHVPWRELCSRCGQRHAECISWAHSRSTARTGTRNHQRNTPPPCLPVYPQERISFNPHPKTLTMAGDYEYFAAQGYHPLAFALAELIDNSLRATKGNRECYRDITVSLITDDKGSQGVICVSDNGSGMTTQELNNWAVMNLSMEDRGLLNADEAKGGLWLAQQRRRRTEAETVMPATRMMEAQLLPGPAVAVAHAGRLLTSR